MPKSSHDAAYGDFQTPPALASAVCRLLVQAGLRPATVVEPTCGTGSFLLAAAAAFEGATLWGQDISAAYARTARAALARHGHRGRVQVGDFFRTAWAERLARWEPPILVLGNPPWVTSAELSVLGVDNLPVKSNRNARSGLAAKTGASNFDISEWMLVHLLELAQGRDVTVAMLVKTTVARRVLAHADANGLALCEASLHRIDAKAAFGAAVDAGLLCFSTRERAPITCRVFADLHATEPQAELAVRDGRLVADVGAYDRAAAVLGCADPPWRSGLKHDCAKVMELSRDGEILRNGLGEPVRVEPALVYPWLKSSDLRGDDRPRPRRWLLLPQRRLGEDTAALQHTAPAAWRYLQEHAPALDGRRSSIYRGQPRFAVFGVGEYSFAPWKVAISGLYKRAAFTLVGPDDHGRPTLLDDTCYFLGFPDEPTATAACWLLRSEPARAVLGAFTFWDAKRPITKQVLDHLDLRALARAALAGTPPPALRPTLRALVR
jgi:N-6 DNA Methylase